MARLRPGRRVRRNVRIPERTGHFLDDVVDPVGGRAHIGPIGGHQDGEVLLGARSNGRREPDRIEQRGDLLRRQCHAHLSPYPGDRHRERERLGHLTPNVDDAVTDRKARNALRQELAEASDGGIDSPRVAAALEARRGFGP